MSCNLTSRGFVKSPHCTSPQYATTLVSGPFPGNGRYVAWRTVIGRSRVTSEGEDWCMVNFTRRNERIMVTALQSHFIYWRVLLDTLRRRLHSSNLRAKRPLKHTSPMSWRTQRLGFSSMEQHPLRTSHYLTYTVRFGRKRSGRIQADMSYCQRSWTNNFRYHMNWKHYWNNHSAFPWRIWGIFRFSRR